MSTMRTYFTVEEWKRLHDLTGLWPLIDDPISTPPSLAAVEAECIEMCKRKWPDSATMFLRLNVICGTRTIIEYIIADEGLDTHYYIETTGPDRPAALVLLVEKIKEAK